MNDDRHFGLSSPAPLDEMEGAEPLRLRDWVFVISSVTLATYAWGWAGSWLLRFLSA